jgi:hypothetical protein
MTLSHLLDTTLRSTGFLASMRRADFSTGMGAFFVAFFDPTVPDLWRSLEVRMTNVRPLPSPIPLDRGWILGLALTGTLTLISSALRGFTCVRCCSTPPASSPRALTGSRSCSWLTVASNRPCRGLAPPIGHSCSTYPSGLRPPGPADPKPKPQTKIKTKYSPPPDHPWRQPWKRTFLLSVDRESARVDLYMCAA